MSMNQHLKALQFRHCELERRIANENKRPLPDFIRLRELKQQKLRLKEEIADIGA